MVLRIIKGLLRLFLNETMEAEGGESGIRTLGVIAGTTVFETAPIDHSGNSPVY